MYNPTIIENFSRPTNVGELESPTFVVEIGNPVCDDKVKLFVSIENNEIKDVLFKAYGCATSIASANILCDFLKNKKNLYERAFKKYGSFLFPNTRQNFRN